MNYVRTYFRRKVRVTYAIGFPWIVWSSWKYFFFSSCVCRFRACLLWTQIKISHWVGNMKSCKCSYTNLIWSGSCRVLSRETVCHLLSLFLLQNYIVINVLKGSYRFIVKAFFNLHTKASPLCLLKTGGRLRLAGTFCGIRHFCVPRTASKKSTKVIIWWWFYWYSYKDGTSTKSIETKQAVNKIR